VAKTGWNRAHAWLIGGMVVNLAGVIGGFVSNRIGDPTWLTTLRAVFLVVTFACLAVSFVEWRRHRAAEQARAERAND